MELNRAKQIVSSSAEITVTYHGQSVWIQSVDENANTARVHTHSKPDEEMDIPISELVEE